MTDAAEEPTVLSVKEIDPATTVPDSIVTLLNVAGLFTEEKSPWMVPPVIDSEDDPERAPP